MPAPTAPAARRIARGLTLIEGLAVVAVAAVLVGSGVPSMQDLVGKVRLDGQSSELSQAVAHARAMAVSHNDGVRLSVKPAEDGAVCLIVHTGDASSCSCAAGGAPQCSTETHVFKASSFPAGGPVSVSANVQSLRFDPINGTVSPSGTVVITGRDGHQVRHVVSLMGRLRTCSPGGAVKGYAPC
jgi:type IV fimbrial biogenesis protein FimT